MDMSKQLGEKDDSMPLYFDGRRKMFEIRAGKKYYPFYTLKIADMTKMAQSLSDSQKITGEIINNLLILATPTIECNDYNTMITDLGVDGVINVFSYYMSLSDFETGEVYEEKHGKLH